MPSLARLRSLAATAFAATVLASSEEPTCTGDDCDVLGSAPEEESALLQVHRANSSWTNPCGLGYEYLPKQSTQKDCKDAGLKYVGNKDAAEDASQCCVKSTWVCNLGTKHDCKPDGVADPTYLGTITWVSFDPRGNCCVPPIPAKSDEPTWTFDTQLRPSKGTCKNKKVSKSCDIKAFWTGDKCMTTAEVDGKYQPTNCKVKLGKCDGLKLSGNMCCTC